MYLGEHTAVEELHTISVQETATADLRATGAKLAVRIAGSSFYTGTEAFKKAAEVVDCIAALQHTGIQEDAIHLRNVSIESETGLFVRSSSAIYLLQVECSSLDHIGAVLAAIAAQKNAKLVAIAWKYDNLVQAKRDLIQNAARNARDAAQDIASVLSLSLLGVHSLEYKVQGLDTDLRVRESSPNTIAKRARVGDALETLNMSHICTVSVTVTAEFLIDTFTPRP